MTAPENPERLWAFARWQMTGVVQDPGRYVAVEASVAEADAIGRRIDLLVRDEHGTCPMAYEPAPVAEYVRADVADREREEAECERDRLRKIFDDAGKGEHDVLALIDHYQQAAIDADKRYWSECGQLVAEHTWERTGLLTRLAVAHEHLALMIRYFEEETAEGDGLREEHAAGYEGAKSALVRCDPGLAGETALIEVAELIERASHVPGLTATLDEARARAQAAEERAAKAEARIADLRAGLRSFGTDPLAWEPVARAERLLELDDAAREAGR